MPEFDEKKQNKKVEELHRKEEEDVARILSEKYGLEYVDLKSASINNEALGILEESKARDALVAIFARVGKKISVAVKSPNKEATKDVIKQLTEKGYEVTSYLTSTVSLERAWSHYHDISSAIKTKAGLLDISGEEIKKAMSELHTLGDARKKIEGTLKTDGVHRTSRIIEIFLAGALSSKASDIHVEPEEQYVNLRFRLDGVLADIIHFNNKTYKLLLSRLKLLSGLKLNIKNEAQDGRFSVRIADREIEVRASILPSAHGESIVLRLLDAATLALPMERLGIPDKLLSVLEEEIKKPNGMILNTGPTGSGKTTMLYAFLNRLNSPGIKTVTIEDPVEYHMRGIVQTQVSENYSFSDGLRSTLRQDPDIIMIGEIREGEVAETAVNASLTGHLVLSTLHTNTAAGAFPRLIDLGVNPKVISSAVNVVLAQRLVRLLKPECRKEVKLSGEEKEVVENILESITDKSLIPDNTDTVFEPNVEEGGCEIPYSGRVGVFEAILMDESIEKLVESSASEHEIDKAARAQGILTMEQDGVLKVLQGITTLSELNRILDLKSARVAGM